MSGKYYGSDWLRPYAMAFWNPKEWLNGQWSKADQDAFDFLYDQNFFGFTPFKNQFDDILNEKSWNSYSAVNQLNYGDIKDPRKFHNNFGSMSGVTHTLQFVSSNVKRLYRD